MSLRAGPEAATEDRHGRVLAHLFDDAGRWVQGAMVEAGMARVYSFADNRALVPQLLAREQAARQAGRGIWALAYYAIRTPEEAGDALDTFQLVEGEVRAAEVRNRRGYLNFGDDWRTDFTAFVDTPALRRFEEAGMDLAALAGSRIRVRGWIELLQRPGDRARPTPSRSRCWRRERPRGETRSRCRGRGLAAGGGGLQPEPGHRRAHLHRLHAGIQRGRGRCRAPS